jgi:anti-sigma B factor antagonist
MATEPQYITHDTIDGITILTFTRSMLDATAIEEVDAVNMSSKPQKLVLDFQSVRQLVSGSLYPDHAPIGPLLKLQKQIRGDRRRLALCGMDPAVQEVFRICRLDQVFEIYLDADVAVCSM